MPARAGKNGRWKPTRQGGKYLFPVKAMSLVYRGKFMEEFSCFLQDSGMELTGELKKELYAKGWVVYAKRPFGGANQVIEYLGRYTHKVAISNHRLESIEGGMVSFRYKDYRDDAKNKVMTLPVGEFLRRFCLYILPRGFRKIRHYGILASRKKAMLRAIQKEMEIGHTGRRETVCSKDPTGYDRKQCPCCKTGRMEIVLTFQAHAPPRLTMSHSPKPLLSSECL